MNNIISKQFFTTLVGVVLLLLGGFSFAQSSIMSATSSYRPSAEEIATYGPGYPEYCFSSVYSNRTECSKFVSQPIPVEADPCYLTGGYQPGCQPTSQPIPQPPCFIDDPYCLPGPLPIPAPQLPEGCRVVGAGKISCMGPEGYPIVAPDLEICNYVGLGHPACGPVPTINPIYPAPVFPLPPLPPLPAPPAPLAPPRPPTVYDYRLGQSERTPDCQHGYLPRCEPITTAKHFQQAYRSGPATPTYRAGEALRFQVRSYYQGYLYVFVTESDQHTKLLYPNAYSNTTRFNPGEAANFPEQNAPYSLGVTAPYGLHKLFFVILSQQVPKGVFEHVRSEYELNNVLVELGLDQGIYHGYGENYFNVTY